MVWRGSCKPPQAFALFLSRLRIFASLREKSLTLRGILGTVTVVALVVVGLAQQLAAGLSNLSFDPTQLGDYADVAAGKWILANTATGVVVMARSRGLIYHYSRRKVV